MLSCAQPKPGESSLYQTFCVLIVAAAGMATLLALLPPAGHDQLWFLLMAKRWLGGAQLYGPTAFDSNPPVIVWLSAVPVQLAAILHLPVTTIGKLLVAAAESGSALLSLFFLRRTRQLRRYEIPAVLAAWIILFAVIPARDFGQRDQILAFLIVPYILAAAISFRDHPLLLPRCAAGLLAAIGIALKPHQALIVCAVELTLLLSPATPLNRPRLRRLTQLARPEIAVIAFLGVALFLAIQHVTPLYLHLALPLLRDTYWAIGHLSPVQLILEAPELCLLGLATAVLFFTEKRKARIEILLLAAAFGAALAYFLQGTGWYYQQLPALGLFGATFTLLLLDRLNTPFARTPLTTPYWLPFTAAAMAILALGLTTYFSGSPFTSARAFAPVFVDPSVPDPAFFASTPPGTPVAILTTSVEGSMMPVARYNLQWAQRTNNLWLLPAILRSQTHGTPYFHRIPPRRLALLDAVVHRWMVEDLTRWRPALILVARCQDPAVSCQELEDRHDDLIAWFKRDPAFNALWAHYIYRGSRGSYDAYALQP
jgi:hypothetical protein